MAAVNTIAPIPKSPLADVVLIDASNMMHTWVNWLCAQYETEHDAEVVAAREVSNNNSRLDMFRANVSYRHACMRRHSMLVNQ